MRLVVDPNYRELWQLSIYKGNYDLGLEYFDDKAEGQVIVALVLIGVL